MGAGNFMLYDHTYGWKVNGMQILSASTSFTCSGNCSFFALPGEPGFDRQFIDSKTKKPVAIDLLNIETWRQHELGVYAVS